MFSVANAWGRRRSATTWERHEPPRRGYRRTDVTGWELTPAGAESFWLSGHGGNVWGVGETGTAVATIGEPLHRNPARPRGAQLATNRVFPGRWLGKQLQTTTAAALSAPEANRASTLSSQGSASPARSGVPNRGGAERPGKAECRIPYLRTLRVSAIQDGASDIMTDVRQLRSPGQTHPLQELTSRIIGCCIEVHGRSDQGSRRWFYQRALLRELDAAGLEAAREVDVDPGA